MAFSVPTFNTPYNVWTNGAGPPGPPRASGMGNLAFGRRGASYQGLYTGEHEPVMSLLLPPGTDVRSLACAGGADTIECPAGTGRYYQVIGVDDVGKGFSNEHRVVLMSFTLAFGFWPAPIP